MARHLLLLGLSLTLPSAGAPPVPAAVVSGIVTDAAGQPLEGVRVDHLGRMVVIAPLDPSGSNDPGVIRTRADGRFRLVTFKSAVVVRKPGYESQRIRLSGDAELRITLQPIQSATRCRLPAAPAFESTPANDIDYTATWYFIRTKQGRQGVISGQGANYSFGAPSDNQVWTSLDYGEIMHLSGVIDAWGRSADGKYWRRRTAFGAGLQYYGQDRDTAEKLDCVLEHVAANPRH